MTKLHDLTGLLKTGVQKPGSLKDGKYNADPCYIYPLMFSDINKIFDLKVVLDLSGQIQFIGVHERHVRQCAPSCTCYKSEIID